jgi:hypothetical protein
LSITSSLIMKGALQAIAGALAQRDLIGSVALIGHRVAHGGDLYRFAAVKRERRLVCVDALGHAVEQAVAAGGVQHGKCLLTILNIVYKLF